MQGIETDYKSPSFSLFWLSTFIKITSSTPIPRVGNSLVYQIKKSDFQSLLFEFFSRKLKNWKTPPIEPKKSFLTNDRFL
jgi:hypothetical protein